MRNKQPNIGFERKKKLWHIQY